ncbi:MAG: response regulator [Betaproteobacteria bacterium]|nr:response regulator [Betaproteobacteria bacterium]
MSITPSEFRYALESNEKNEHYQYLQKQFNRVMTEENLLYYYAGAFDPKTGMVMYLEGHGNVFGLNGKVPLSIFPQAAFDAFESGATRVSDIYRLNIDGSWGISTYAPIIDEDGKTVGLVGVLVSLGEALSNSYNFALTMLLISLLVFIAIAWVPVLYIRRSVAKPLFSLQTASNKLAQGDMDIHIPVWKTNDEVGMLSHNFSTMQEIVIDMHQEIKDLVKNATEGNLNYRARPDKYPGEWREVITKFNDLMDTIVLPIDEAAGALHKIAGGDFSARVSGEYKGYFDRIKSAVNSTAIDLDRYLTEKEKAERDLFKAEQKANRAKSDFLSHMSHEIRTPMNGIIGMLHLLRRSHMDAQQRDHLAKIEQSAQHLLALVNDILDLSKIDADKMLLESLPVNVPLIVANVCSIIGEAARKKGLTVVNDLDPLPSGLLGDTTRLTQVLLNYASNAVKFTERGQITIRARAGDSDDLSAVIRFEVDDTGIGVEQQDLERLFQAFEQADNSTTRVYQGSGLGLAINRQLAVLMRGDAGATSTLGQGSCFWFTARLARGEHDAATTASAVQSDAESRVLALHAGKRVLLVEDEPINQEISQMLLSDAGLEVDLAGNGEEAVALAASNDYALILMDMQMPIMDGLDATRLIRQQPRDKKVPIVAMTANAFAEDRERCLIAGMDDFVAKPVDPEVLFSKILEQLGNS